MQYASREAKVWKANKDARSKKALWKAKRRLSKPIDYLVRKTLGASIPLLSRAGRSIQLKAREGYALTPPEIVPLTARVVDACVQLFERRKPQLDDIRAKRDSYFYNVLGEGGFEEHKDLLHAYMTQDSILIPVMRYLGEFPIFQGVKMMWTPPNESLVSSQQWHLDGLDSTQVKFFLYLSDIDEGAGPTTILSREDTRRVVQEYDYVSGRLSDEQVAAVVPRDRWIPLLGNKGTLATCDTSTCLHFGGRGRDRDRLFLLFHYSTSAPFKVEELSKFAVNNWKERLLAA